MPEENLILSRWDSIAPVIIPSSILSELTSYHLMGIRFLYECFDRDRKGAILNHEDGMNVQIQVSAFLNALNPLIDSESSILIVSTDENLPVWHYHLTNQGRFNVIVLSETNCVNILQGVTYRVILSTLSNLNLLKDINEMSLYVVVVDELDVFIKKNAVKRLRSKFNIGLTKRNFLKHPDQKLFWSMLNWSNPEVVGKFAEFCREDDEHLKNLRDPYRNWWQRLTWNFCDSFKKPSQEEEEIYTATIQKWSTQYTFLDKNAVSCKNKIQTRKRKSIKNELKSEDSDDIVKNPETTSKQKNKQSKLQKTAACDTNELESNITSTKNIFKHDIVSNNNHLKPSDSSDTVIHEDSIGTSTRNSKLGSKDSLVNDRNSTKTDLLSMLFGNSQTNSYSQKNDILSLLYG